MTGEAMPSTNAQIREKAASAAALTDIPAIRRMMDLMIDGASLYQAAKELGIKPKLARLAFQNTDLRRQFAAELQGLRTAERIRNHHAAIAIREKGLEPDAKAADRKAALDAIKYLDGESEASSISINTSGPVLVGYAIKLDSHAEGPRVIARQDGAGHVLTQQEALSANPLIEHDHVTDLDR